MSRGMRTPACASRKGQCRPPSDPILFRGERSFEMTQARAVLAGTGISIPPLEVDNEMLSRIIETNDQWVRERSGIATRYYVEPGVASSDLAVEASRAAPPAPGNGAD